VLLELETGNKTKIIATKTDYIIQQSGKMMLELNSLTGEIRAQFQQYTSIIERKIENIMVDMGNEFKEMLDQHLQAIDGKTSCPIPMNSCSRGQD
jgi:hypothetical protein